MNVWTIRRFSGAGFVVALMALLLGGCNMLPWQGAETDRQFITSAAESGLAEVELSRLALQRASDPAVRDYAERMVNAHIEANQQLVGIAAEEGISTPRSLSPEHEQLRQELAGLSGSAFDRRYMEAQIAEHRRAINLFEETAEEAESAQLRRFASNTLPTLETHLQRARQVAQEVGSA